MSGRTSSSVVADEAAARRRVALPPDPERDLHRIRTIARAAAASRTERLDEALRARPGRRGHPHRHVGEARVVAPRLAVRGLVLDAEVAAARFLAGERVAAHQLAELEEVGDAARPLELLVELAPGRRARARRPRTPRAARATSSIALAQPRRGCARARRRPRAAGRARGGSRSRCAGRAMASSRSIRACDLARRRARLGAVLGRPARAARRRDSRPSVQGRMK